MAKIVGPTQYVQSTLDNGSPNPFWDLINEADVAGAKITKGDTQSTVEDLDDYKRMSLPVVQALVAAGCEVYDYEAWIVVPEADLSNNIPAYLPGAPSTWQAWPIETHTWFDHDGAKAIGTDCQGARLLGSQLTQLIVDGVDVRSLATIQAEQSANPPE